MTLNLTLTSLAFFTRNEKLVIFRAGKSMSRVLLSEGRLISRQGEGLIGARKHSTIVTSEEALSVDSVQVIMASSRWINTGRQKKNNSYKNRHRPIKHHICRMREEL